jgi:hypothetical protein
VGVNAFKVTIKFKAFHSGTLIPSAIECMYWGRKTYIQGFGGET